MENANQYENVVTAYHFLATNYAEGDEIFAFGFSRGAYTARALAGCLTEMGLLRTHNLESFRQVYEHYKAHSDSGPQQHHRHADEDGPTPSFRSCEKWQADAELKASLQKVKVKVVGVWDTVGSLGLPDSGFTSVTGWNDSFKFHDTALNDRKLGRFFHVFLVRMRELMNVYRHRARLPCPCS